MFSEVIKMKHLQNKVEDIKIAYIGGGSRSWAWGLMSDLISCDDISGTVHLFDIDNYAAQCNKIIGDKISSLPEAKSKWNYVVSETRKDALENADFVIISILPGTFDEMHSDVHTPEKYGIYQTVGDSTGPGGILRAMRTIPMYEVIAKDIKEYCPNAWVINYTNPMTLCTRALYRVFPEIKAFGCCHEVFSTQKLMLHVLEDELGIIETDRSKIKVNVVGVNHFTWLTDVRYKNIDLMPYYKSFCEKNRGGYFKGEFVSEAWNASVFKSKEAVKMELFEKYGVVAAAGDRHLVEFLEGKWYLESPEKAHEKQFKLTSVDWRRGDLKEKLAKRDAIVAGELEPELKRTGEEGVDQIRALLGLRELTTNVNIPNVGQIPNLPLGAVVETNAVFRDGTVTPVMAGALPRQIEPLVLRICVEQEILTEGIAKRDLDMIFNAFVNDPNVTCSIDDAKKLFDEMCENTKEYLTSYPKFAN